MGQMANITHSIAAGNPSLHLDATGCRSYEVGNHAADSLVEGVLASGGPELEGLTGKALSDAMVARYGDGFGFPWQPDPSVAPAISALPDEHNRNRGWLNEHNRPAPTPETLQKLGFTGMLTTTDMMDLSACHNFVDQVIVPLNDGREIGTGPNASSPASPASPGKPSTSSPVKIATSSTADSELTHLRSARDQILGILAQAEATFPPIGKGGVYVRIAHAAFNGIKKVLTASTSILPLLILVLALSACGTLATRSQVNKTVIAAGAGQVAGGIATIQCSRMVANNPAMVPIILDRIARARLIIEQQNPLLGLFSLDSSIGSVDPQTRIALAILSGYLADQDRITKGVSMGIFNGCETGVTLTAVPSPMSPMSPMMLQVPVPMPPVIVKPQ